MVNTCVMHGMHGLVVAQRRLFGRYTVHKPVMTIHVQTAGDQLVSLNKVVDEELIRLHLDQWHMAV